MADVSITAANVVPATTATLDKTRLYGETVAAGSPVYISGGKYLKAQQDTQAHADALGVAVNSGSLNQPAAVCTSGSVAYGAIFTAGEIYCVGAAAGGLCPVGDLGAGEFSTIIGMATTTSNLVVDIQASGVAHG